MTNWLSVVRRAVDSGSSAAVASLIALAAGGQRDCRSAFAPVNAVSHWIWRGRALRQQDASLRYTVPGYGIHHAMSILWALLYEERLGRAPAAGPLRTIATGLAVSAAACFVDLRLTPERLTPGFERRLRPGPLAVVYVAFGLGLTLPRLARTVRRRRPSPERNRQLDAEPASVPPRAAALPAGVAAGARAPRTHHPEGSEKWNRSTTSPPS